MEDFLKNHKEYLQVEKTRSSYFTTFSYFLGYSVIFSPYYFLTSYRKMWMSANSAGWNTKSKMLNQSSEYNARESDPATATANDEENEEEPAVDFFFF